MRPAGTETMVYIKLLYNTRNLLSFINTHRSVNDISKLDTLIPSV